MTVGVYTISCIRSPLLCILNNAYYTHERLKLPSIADHHTSGQNLPSKPGPNPHSEPRSLEIFIANHLPIKLSWQTPSLQTTISQDGDCLVGLAWIPIFNHFSSKPSFPTTHPPSPHSKHSHCKTPFFWTRLTLQTWPKAPSATTNPPSPHGKHPLCKPPFLRMGLA